MQEQARRALPVTVYVDDSRIPATVGRIRGRWSHLFADSRDELHAFAQAIGLQRAWFQDDEAGLWHYDVTESKRRQAVRAGARAVTWREAVNIMRQRDGLPPIGGPAAPAASSAPDGQGELFGPQGPAGG